MFTLTKRQSWRYMPVFWLILLFSWLSAHAATDCAEVTEILVVECEAHLTASDPATKEDAPNLVTLAYFTATALETEILLEWQTTLESDNAGFHIWRATGEGWKYEDYSTVIRLTERLISSQGYDYTSYSYIDTNVETGLTYYYGLEDIDNAGQSIFHWDLIDSAIAK